MPRQLTTEQREILDRLSTDEDELCRADRQSIAAALADLDAAAEALAPVGRALANWRTLHRILPPDEERIALTHAEADAVLAAGDDKVKP